MCEKPYLFHASNTESEFKAHQPAMAITITAKQGLRAKLLCLWQNSQRISFSVTTQMFAVKVERSFMEYINIMQNWNKKKKDEE